MKYGALRNESLRPVFRHLPGGRSGSDSGSGGRPRNCSIRNPLDLIRASFGDS